MFRKGQRVRATPKAVERHIFKERVFGTVTSNQRKHNLVLVRKDGVKLPIQWQHKQKELGNCIICGQSATKNKRNDRISVHFCSDHKKQVAKHFKHYQMRQGQTPFDFPG